MFSWFLEKVGLGSKGYKGHPEAVIITCYYNPKNSQPRLDAFNKFYETIKHLPHRILECVTEGSRPQLPDSPHIKRIYTTSNLWHKEQLLNKIVRDLPHKYQYVFWVDADVLFSNNNWIVDAVEQLQRNAVVQLFEYCIHLEQGESRPSFNVDAARRKVGEKYEGRRLWRGYAANYVDGSANLRSKYYDVSGHVGFAWGARRSVLIACPLFENGVIGGGDGVIAYASTGRLRDSASIADMFGPILPQVYTWGDKWNLVVGKRVGYVKGDLYHIWHGDIKERQYYKRIKEFASHLKAINDENERDKNGLLTTRSPNAKRYVSSYYDRREPTRHSHTDNTYYHNTDDGFATSVALGYALDDGITGGLLGGNLIGGMVGDMLNTSDETRDDGSQKAVQEPTQSHTPYHSGSDHGPTTQPATQPTDIESVSVASADTDNFS